jgi:hypothetical protein
MVVQGHAKNHQNPTMQNSKNFKAITGAMKLTPNAAMEVLPNLTPLDLLIMVEARMALYRLQIAKQKQGCYLFGRM